jgi:SAM-dependent methyltransferase
MISDQLLFQRDSSFTRRLRISLQLNPALFFLRKWFLPSHPDLLRLTTEGRIVIRTVKQQTYQNCVDIGCGRGMYLIRYARPKTVTFGVEPQQKHREYLANLVTGKKAEIRLLEGDATKVPLADDSVQLAISTQCLEHIQDDTSALREVRRILQVAGRLLLTVPVPPVPDSEDNRHPVYGHKRDGYLAEDILALAESCGLRLQWRMFCFRTPARIALRLVERFRIPLALLWPLLLADWILTGPSERFLPAVQILMLEKHIAPGQS